MLRFNVTGAPRQDGPAPAGRSKALAGATWQEAAADAWAATVRPYLRRALANRGVPARDWDDLLAEGALITCEHVRRLFGSGRPLYLPFLASQLFRRRARRYYRGEKVRSAVRSKFRGRRPRPDGSALTDLRIDLEGRAPALARVLVLRAAGYELAEIAAQVGFTFRQVCIRLDAIKAMLRA